MELFKDAHYFHIPSQGNIYTTTQIKLANGKTVILAASLKREIYYFEYLENAQGILIPTTKEVSFTYIPGGAEIIALDAFNKSPSNNELVIGITIIKNSLDSDTLETFLNIYSQLEDQEDFDIENIAQNCLTIELNFIPYKLMHTYLVTWKNDEIINKEWVFLLSGSDHLVHIYRENPSEHFYKELESTERFPEFGNMPSPVVWIDCYHINNFLERITAFACECGYVKLMKVNTKTSTVIYNFSTRFGNYISNVNLYLTQDTQKKHKVEKILPKNLLVEKKENRPILNMVVVNSILPSMVFCDVLKFGLSHYYTLPRHDECTVFTSCIIADIDLDGDKEILVGTSSEEMLLYKYDAREDNWFLEELKHIASPVLSMGHTDVSGDGVKELIVFSMKGLHILQHDLNYIERKLCERIDNLVIPKFVHP